MVGALRSCWLAARRHIDGDAPDVTPLSYADGTGALMGTVIGLSVLEVGVAHLVVPWPAVRWSLVVLGVLTVVVVLGFWAGMHTHPHLVTPDGLRLRYAHYLSVDLPWEDVDTVRRISLHEPTSIVVRDGRLHLPPSGSTNLLVTLRRDREVPLLLGRKGLSREVAFQADDPALALRAVRPFLVE